MPKEFDLSFILPILPFLCGAVAQLGERLNGIQEVEGSIPFGSTKSLMQIRYLEALEGHANFLRPKLPVFSH
jgi:hypothetical protein